MRGIYCAVVLENTATLRYVFLNVWSASSVVKQQDWWTSTPYTDKHTLCQ